MFMLFKINLIKYRKTYFNRNSEKLRKKNATPSEQPQIIKR